MQAVLLVLLTRHFRVYEEAPGFRPGPHGGSEAPGQRPSPT